MVSSVYLLVYKISSKNAWFKKKSMLASSISSRNSNSLVATHTDHKFIVSTLFWPNLLWKNLKTASYLGKFTAAINCPTVYSSYLWSRYQESYLQVFWLITNLVHKLISPKFLCLSQAFVCSWEWLKWLHPF